MSNLIVHHQADWPYEQIKFDPTDPENLPAETYQYTSYAPESRDMERKRVRYVVRSMWDENRSELSIEYRAEDQRYLPEGWPSADDVEFWRWGIHILTIKPDQDSGSSTWKHVLYAKVRGHGWRLARLTGGKKRDRKSAKQIRREQQGPLRDQLLEMDGCCALTGETCQTVLEAAHIIAAHQGGLEYPENGILLRADIHRLFDAGEFSICSQSGQVLLVGERLYGSFDLGRAKVDADMLARIARALEQRRALK